MNIRLVLLVGLVFSILLIGCASSTPSNYATYSQPQGAPPQQGQYVGGGCGVAPETSYNAPAETSAQSGL